MEKGVPVAGSGTRDLGDSHPAQLLLPSGQAGRLATPVGHSVHPPRAPSLVQPSIPGRAGRKDGSRAGEREGARGSDHALGVRANDAPPHPGRGAKTPALSSSIIRPETKH